MNKLSYKSRAYLCHLFSYHLQIKSDTSKGSKKEIHSVTVDLLLVSNFNRFLNKKRSAKKLFKYLIKINWREVSRGRLTDMNNYGYLVSGPSKCGMCVMITWEFGEKMIEKLSSTVILV